LKRRKVRTHIDRGIRVKRLRTKRNCES